MSFSTLKDLLTRFCFRKKDVDMFLDPNRPTWNRFDPELGYVPSNVRMQDGVDDSISVYTYEKECYRKMFHYADQPCRINTYGDSFAQGQQVSDGETWQEYLAAHLQEPIRNFGSGGYGVYQAYLRARRAEQGDTKADYVILGIYDDDHVRNIDASRWIRTFPLSRNPNNPEPQMIHGIPWSHLRYDISAEKFEHQPGKCKSEEDLIKLTDPNHFYETFKDDQIAQLFLLEIGGHIEDHQTAALEELAEALGVNADLRDPEKRKADAFTVRHTYGLKSTMHILDETQKWFKETGQNLMVVLCYGRGKIGRALNGKERLDTSLLKYLDDNKLNYVDTLAKHLDHYKIYSLSPEEYLSHYFIDASAAAVFNHHKPSANHYVAFSLKDEVVNWLNPKPPAYNPEI